MTNEQQQVKNWMLSFGQEVKEKPEIPSLEVRRLRAKLILEEAFETIKALGLSWSIEQYQELEGDWIDFIEFYDTKNPNLTEILDGCEDLKVVVEGTLAACGLLKDTFSLYRGEDHGMDLCEDPHFNEVMRSNWTKLWTLTEIQPIQDNYRFVIACIKPSSKPNDRSFLVKDSSGKVIKSPSYSPPSFTI